MQTIRSISQLRAELRTIRAAGGTVGFVPTMGFLHEGHLQLVDIARRKASCCVMSIFVNPLQFGPREDLARYPRDEDGDSRKATARGVDILFMPTVEEMYRRDRVVAVTPLRGATRWEGEIRPGHFEGVLTVVNKLFNIVQPDVAVFGQKDAQQAALVRAMVRDLDMPIDFVVAPTARDYDGLALSSRNTYLSADDRRTALTLPRALDAVRAAFAGGERSSAALERAGRAVLNGVDGVTPDYVAVVNPTDLEPIVEAEPGSLVVAAARVGPVRLLDNAILGT